MPENRAPAILLDQRAMRAWRELHPECPDPQAVEILKVSHRSAVYRLTGVGKDGTSVVAKRCGQDTARIERSIYERVLPRLSLLSLHYYGSVEEADGEFCWLFLEDAAGEEYSLQREEHRGLAARWLGLMHTSAAGVAHAAGLPDRGPDYYFKQLRIGRRTIERGISNPVLQDDERKVLEFILTQCGTLEAHWAELVEKSCSGMPRTLVHGDFVEKNVRVRSERDGFAMLPMDWETAGWGVPAADLAQCPDIATYASTVRQFWPHHDLQSFQRLANFGTICRLLAAIVWAASRLEYEWVARAMRLLQFYGPDLAASIHAAIGPAGAGRTRSFWPGLATLTAGLKSVFGHKGAQSREITVLGRELSFSGTYAKEILTCRFGDGTRRRLLCKYGPPSIDACYGHRSGVPYEAQIYRHLLPATRLSVPTFYGSHADPSTGGVWLILEYLEENERVHETPEPASSMIAAAQWIGRFHAVNEGRLSRPELSFLQKYDSDYYLGWAERTSLFAHELHRRFNWLGTLCRRFGELVGFLLRPSLTVIHGEYTPKNVLIKDGIIYAVDWESAAIATGEIDLACLTQAWPEICEECESEYQRARWPEGPPSDFRQRLDVARLYMQFRWLGDRPDRTVDENCRWRFEELRVAGERVGLI